MIIQRWAEDDSIAFHIAQGMENAGADVFSISFRGHKTHTGALEQHAQYIVWAKVESESMIDGVDKAINKALDEK
jgi:enoyl-[acyl-carrier-protein] reductase (NADH)